MVADESEAPESEAPKHGAGGTENLGEQTDSSRTRTSLPSASSQGQKKRKRSLEEEDSDSSKLVARPRLLHQMLLILQLISLTSLRMLAHKFALCSSSHLITHFCSNLSTMLIGTTKIF